MARPREPQITSMALLDFLDLVDPGQFVPYLCVMISLSPSLDNYWQGM